MIMTIYTSAFSRAFTNGGKNVDKCYRKRKRTKLHSYKNVGKLSMPQHQSETTKGSTAVGSSNRLIVDQSKNSSTNIFSNTYNCGKPLDQREFLAGV